MSSILIIDDEIEVGDALKRVLERAGFEVTVMTSSTNGINAFERAPADLVITDIIMPRIHGIDVIKAIRKRDARAPIIAISGGGNFGPLDYQPDAITTSSYLAAAKQAGANEVLTKPFDKQVLVDAVKRLLGS